MGLKDGLARMRGKFADALSATEQQEVYQSIERALLTADTGTAVSREIIVAIKQRAGNKPSLEELGKAIRAEFTELLGKLQAPANSQQHRPHTMMLVGSNGSGKTTTSAKLAQLAANNGRSVVLAACDTFRAAAPEQLMSWANKLEGKIRIVTGANDPAAVAYNAVTTATKQQEDLLIIDTAGRQSNNKSLMAEAAKIVRATGKALPGSPHDVVLIIDANTGQNALSQLAEFDQAVGITGLIITKLDSTARGGFLLAIALKQPKPVLYIGVGESSADLLPFDAKSFVDALFVA